MCLRKSSGLFVSYVKTMHILPLILWLFSSEAIDPSIRFVPVRCLGGTHLVWIADAFSKGIDGVLLIGCKFGENYQCHFVKGSELANFRFSKVGETLNKLQLEADR